MPHIFVSHAPQDAACAEQIRQGVEGGGYSTWREPASLSIESILYPRTVESVILGSAALVLLWSGSAARSDWVERHLLFAQQLQKPILPVLLDGTTLPNTLVGVMPINSSTSCVDAVARLLPLLPPLVGEDPLLKLAEQAAHQYIGERKAAIDAASAMLQQLQSGGQREAVLAILEYMAHNDQMDGVREKAREALAPYAKQTAASPALSDARESRHTFGVRCKNGHVSYFDRNEVCTAYAKFPREIRQSAGQKLDEVLLKCDTCGVEVAARVDCSKYRNH